MRSRRCVTGPVPVIPILGARKLAQFEDDIKSLEIVFTPDQLRRLDEVSAVPLSDSRTSCSMACARFSAFGGMRDRIKI